MNEYMKLVQSALEVTDRVEGVRKLQLLIECKRAMNGPSVSSERILQIVREDLAYMAGYDNHVVRVRVEELYGCVHPYFGPAKNGVPSPTEAMALGSKMAEASIVGHALNPVYEQPTGDVEELVGFEDRLRSRLKEVYGDK